ncbi:MAG: TolC family protein, partial [Bacteroidota bacterium]
MKAAAAILILAASVLRAQELRVLSLEEAVREGRERNSSLRASRARADAALEKSQEARTLLLPSVAAEVSYRRVSRVDPFRVTVPFLPDPVVISPWIPDNYGLRIGILHPVFSGFRLEAGARAAEALAEASVRESVSDEGEAAVATVTAYWSVYRLREADTVLAGNVARLESYLKDAENLVAAGLATRSDLLRIRLQLTNARTALLDLRREEHLAVMSLNTLVGLHPETRLVLASHPARGDLPGGGSPAELCSLA